MNELFEDKMTSKFRKVLENYEPAYSPQAWEKLRQQLPVKIPFWKRISKWYFIAAASLIISGIFMFRGQENINQSGQNLKLNSIQTSDSLKLTNSEKMILQNNPVPEERLKTLNLRAYALSSNSQRTIELLHSGASLYLKRKSHREPNRDQ